MNTIIDLLRNLWNLLACIGELLGYVLRFVSAFFQTRAFKLCWRWKSRKKPGRPPVTRELRELIRKLSREDSIWGTGQIRDHPLLLHYDPPCEDTILKYMVKPKNPRGKSTWLALFREYRFPSYSIYQINLVFNQPMGERMTLMACLGKQQIRSYAQTLAEFLNVPLMDNSFGDETDSP